jgi:hypothetical protein
MYWKMSIDLSRPLVSSMGHHDPLDGLVTYQRLHAASQHIPDETAESSAARSLGPEIAGFAAMCAGGHWQTSDELGIGSLLVDAGYLAQLIAADLLADTGMLESLLADAVGSLRAFAAANHLGYPADHRLAFRELGLAIGLQALDNIRHGVSSRPESFHNPGRVSAALGQLGAATELQQHIVQFWLDAEHRSVRSWLDHADINNVMLATSLAPGSYLEAGYPTTV